MTALLLAPHNDDETLFASFLLQHHRPHVVICLKSQVQAERYGISAETREAETEAALGELFGGVPSWEQWAIPDRPAGTGELLERMSRLRSARRGWSKVIAPAFEEGGHADHNTVAKAAEMVFEGEITHRYLTYVRGAGKTVGREVEPEPWMIERKLRALACYRSQIELADCRPWFMGDLREYQT